MIFQNEKTPFQAIKTRSSKSRKIDIFPKGLTHGFGPKMAIFQLLFFQEIYARKMSFTIFQNEKTSFQTIKTRSSKSRKIDIFPKGLTNGFGQKMAIFPIFLFQEKQAKKMSFTIFQNEKAPFQASKIRSSKTRKTDIFPSGLTHGFGLKMAIFPTFIFQEIYARKMSFTIFQNEKTPFQAIKTRSLKSRKIDIFPKGLTHGFWSKNGHFSNFFFQAMQTSKMSLTIFQNEKTSFQAIKEQVQKLKKIDIFPKRLTHGFGPKMPFFPTFIFQEIQPRKMSFTVFQNEKTPFQALKTRS